MLRCPFYAPIIFHFIPTTVKANLLKGGSNRQNQEDFLFENLFHHRMIASAAEPHYIWVIPEMPEGKPGHLRGQCLIQVPPLEHNGAGISSSA